MCYQVGKDGGQDDWDPHVVDALLRLEHLETANDRERNHKHFAEEQNEVADRIDGEYAQRVGRQPVERRSAGDEERVPVNR